ncbi:5-methyltetrahydropteroyltriglutamate--homocysteine S-methyltransferase [Lipingzhangella sp. LS1_29]|uniref:5-methyltetrahydropteroyltriglutamate--homocysteine methyltransferase n=1 Tax=Lipingzhangella rawalii TaxID=2055835 RepID=A0ABU2H8H0_9ACTN|nr:5-methyltetrahydropteroyltriglutamate--homocysteine S-methyltransferase [Lipingzhangella rawalii]MDS1271601.1 5-methyltetrahydropteroyltriglutamate--homocysteine S-methyltransferase [Lipingzhangella rawalii]
MTDRNPVGATILGYPRIGPDRELKRAVESYWAGTSTAADLEETARTLRVNTWDELKAAGLDSIPSNTFSYYDQVLDTAALVGALPPRHTELGLSPLDTYFAAARGTQQAPALEMTKWFDTNYHYLVPELGPDTGFALAGSKPIDEYVEARKLGLETRPVLLGPVTFLLLAKAHADAPEDFQPLSLLERLLPVYEELLAALHSAGAEWVQLDEPAFVADRSAAELAALDQAYTRLGGRPDRPSILVASYFGSLGEALGTLARVPVEGLALDLVTDPTAGDAAAAQTALRDKEVVAGVVDGRNIWRTDVDTAMTKAATLLGSVGRLGVSTSCSLLHVPYDVDRETAMPERLRSWLAFARQKVAEVVLLGRALRHGQDAASVVDELARARAAVADRGSASDLREPRVRARLDSLRPEHAQRGDYAKRAGEQQSSLGLPALPTTTIGSFPQTDELRRARAQHRAGQLDTEQYHAAMRSEIERVIRLQEDIGLDVLVHGEPERNDMVQYFAEQLRGFAATEHGWVQSYGSRCVRPPVLFGDVSRPEPMTVEWATFAQSLTDRPVKGMLTGPVTILAWSFVRDDQPLADTARQVALAIRDEVHDLESAGIRAIQVDEPALRELLPLRQSAHKEYLSWSVESFRLATSGISDSTQIHTHLCYSEFGEILPGIAALDADVTSIEAARSRMEVLSDLNAAGFARGVGPGVYDIHSPRVPDVDEISNLLRTAVAAVPAERVWVNPDCGLKTRGYAEVEPALRNLVSAARQVRAEQR